MQIRIAQRNDYHQLLSLLRQLSPSDPTPSEFELKAFEQIIESHHLDLIVADDGGILLGSCYINIIPNMTRGGRSYALIENVITDGAHRNKGIGKALLHRAIEIAGKHNCYKVMLMSERGREAAHNFYASCGFDPDEKQAFVLRLA